MSKYFKKVKSFYDEKLWTLIMVKNAVDRWLTEEEFTMITGEQYKNNN
jgi:hypothetical protein